MRIRHATSDDAEELASLLADYLLESYDGDGGITPDQLRRDVLGDRPRHHILLAESGTRTVGFIGWDAVYELQWAVAGGRVGDLFVVSSHRGLGIALALIAGAAAVVRADGGAFLCGSAYERESTRRTYARFAVVAPSGETYLSNRAFQQTAELAELAPRDILRALPPVQWNDEPCESY